MFIVDLLLPLNPIDLHANDIKGVVGEIASYHMKDWLSPFLVFTSYASFGLSLTFPFVFCVMVLAIGFNWIFCIASGSDKYMIKQPTCIASPIRSTNLNSMHAWPLPML